MGKKYFISDTHIGERGKIDDFEEKEENFCMLLKNIIEDNTEGDPGELVLLGDFFDFLEVSTKGQDFKDVEKKVKYIIDKIENRYSSLFSAIHEYLKAKQKIFYVCGNHDYYMLFPRIYHMVAQRMIPSEMVDLSEGYRLFQVSDYYISRKYKIYAEHGHRFDSENWHHNGMPECLGSLLVKKFLIEWEEQYPELDNLRPRGNMYFLVRDRSEKVPGRDPDKEIEKMLEAMDGVHSEYLKLCGEYNFTHSDVYWRAKKIKALLSTLQESNWWNKVVLWLSKTSIVDALSENCITYRNKAIELMDMDRTDNIANQKDLDFQPAHFIFGHTHFFDHYELEGGRNYFNTASWLNTIFYDKNKKESSLDKIIAKTPVLVFSEAEKEPALCEISKSGEMERIDFNKIKERYENLGIKF